MDHKEDDEAAALDLEVTEEDQQLYIDESMKSMTEAHNKQGSNFVGHGALQFLPWKSLS